MIEFREVSDIDELMLWRAEVLRAVFGSAPSEELLEANRRYYERHVPEGSHRATVAYADGLGAGCGAACLYQEMPSPDNPSGRCAYLMNIYVRPPFRRRGVGSAIVRHLLEMLRREGFTKIYLETTEAGRGVYSALGFADMKDYMKYGIEND